MINKLVDSLQKVICTATTTAVDSKVTNNDYFKRRVLGFKAEIEFEKAIENYSGSSLRFVEGGQFISKNVSGDAGDKNFFLYSTMDFEAPDIYIEVYKKIANWDEVGELLYVKILEEGWGTEVFKVTSNSGEKIDTNILTPKFIFYVFDKQSLTFSEHATQDFTIFLNHFDKVERNPSLYKLRGDDQFSYFKQYDIRTLMKIYATRYFIDYVLRQARNKYLIDLDGFILKDDQVVLVEIKEKTPITNDCENDESKWQYGWDSRRLLWYLYLLNKIKLPVLYNVRQIKDRENREFKQWDSLFINEFLSGTSWNNSRSGGGGGDTLLAPYLYFHRLEDVLNNL